MEAVSPLSLPAFAAISLLALVAIYSRSFTAWNARSRGRPLPPGPKPLPFIGNIFDFPTTKQGAAFRDMSAQYGERSTSPPRSSHVLTSSIGDIMHLKMLGRHMLVLGSSDVIFELLDKHSANTSDRLVSPLTSL